MISNGSTRSFDGHADSLNLLAGNCHVSPVQSGNHVYIISSLPHPSYADRDATARGGGLIGDVDS